MPEETSGHQQIETDKKGKAVVPANLVVEGAQEGEKAKALFEAER
jgi:hypothetical protein